MLRCLAKATRCESNARRFVSRSVEEFMTFFSRTLAERTALGQRQSVEEQGALRGSLAQTDIGCCAGHADGPCVHPPLAGGGPLGDACGGACHGVYAAFSIATPLLTLSHCPFVLTLFPFSFHSVHLPCPCAS